MTTTTNYRAQLVSDLMQLGIQLTDAAGRDGIAPAQAARRLMDAASCRAAAQQVRAGGSFEVGEAFRVAGHELLAAWDEADENAIHAERAARRDGKAVAL